jgi:GxxExxY protein
MEPVRNTTERTEGAEISGSAPASPVRENDITDAVIGAAIEVHRHLGPGLLEGAYEECLCYELSQLGIPFQRQVRLPIEYKGVKLDCGYRIDLVVADVVLVELKAIEECTPIHFAQLLTYLKFSGKRVGLLINFNVPVLKKGLKRIVNHYMGGPIEARASASSAIEPGEDAKPEPRSKALRFSPRLRASALNQQSRPTATTRGPH